MKSQRFSVGKHNIEKAVAGRSSRGRFVISAVFISVCNLFLSAEPSVQAS